MNRPVSKLWRGYYGVHNRYDEYTTTEKVLVMQLS